MKYHKNFLEQVVFQLDFDPVLSLVDAQPASFQDAIKEQLPRTKEGEEIDIEMAVSSKQSVKTEVSNRRRKWLFSTDSGSKTVALSANRFSLIYNEYSCIKSTVKDFDFFWNAFQASYTIDQLNRVGLRYINRITLDTGSPTDWDGYINERIRKATLDLPSPSSTPGLARSMHVAYWRSSEWQMKFQFGVHNSGFPNPVAKREFILDFDCYSVGPTEARNASNCLVEYNGLIEAMFEECIDKKLRKMMEPIDESATSS